VPPFFRNQHDFALNDAGVTDQRASRLDDNFRQIIAENRVIAAITAWA